jgi:ATP-binding cassette subfamily F protein uup
VANLDLLIMRGDRLGIVGPNGAGKTTLIKLLTGALEPDSGAIRLGTNLQTVTLDQSRQSLDPNAMLSDVITDGRGSSVTVNGETKHVISYMKDFLFPPEKARTPVSVLSGGERGRLILARELAKPSNLLVLDEPTNDLDLETLDMLQEMLADYQGTILLVSHDRDFLDRCATSVLMAEGDGKWTEYAGGYSDMVTQRGLGVEARKLKAEAAKAPSPQAAAAPPQAQRKLSFKEKHALETLPATMKKLESEIATLEAKLADAALFTRDPKAFEQAVSRLSSVRDELAAAEEQWLELEMKRESLEG